MADLEDIYPITYTPKTPSWYTYLTDTAFKCRGKYYKLLAGMSSSVYYYIRERERVCIQKKHLNYCKTVAYYKTVAICQLAN